MPIARKEDQEKVQKVTTKHVRLWSRSKRDGSPEWIDITKTLKPPANLKDGVLTFKVKSPDSSFGVVTTESCEKPDIAGLLSQDASVQQYAGFQACLCDIGAPSKQQLILCCYPFRSKNTLWTEISSGYKVVCRGKERSQEPLKKEEKVFFSLSDALTPTEEISEEIFLRFLGEDSFEKNFPVLVAKPGSFPKIRFYTEKKNLCSLYIFPVLPLQTSQNIPDDAHLAELLEKRMEPFTSQHLVQIKDDAGNCWEDLGQELGIDQAKLRNLRDDFRTNRDRANGVLQIWMEENGREATVGCLACKLMQIGHRRIADKLLGIQISPRCQKLEKERDDVKKELHPLNLQLNEEKKISKSTPKRKHPTTKNEDLHQKIKKLENQINELESSNKVLKLDKKKLEEGQKQLAKKKKDQEEKNKNLVTEYEKMIEKNNLEIEKLRGQDGQEKLCEELKKEIARYEKAMNRAFLPDDKKEFSGVLSKTNGDKSFKPSASRSSSGPGKADDIFSHTAAKYCGTSDSIGSWWCVDLGKNYRLVVTHYALRNGRGDGKVLVKGWKFQGSNDNSIWTDINYISDSKQISSSKEYPTSRWTVEGDVRAFRYFRISQRGMNSDKEYGIYLSGMDLYGTLAKL